MGHQPDRVERLHDEVHRNNRRLVTLEQQHIVLRARYDRLVETMTSNDLMGRISKLEAELAAKG